MGCEGETDGVKIKFSTSISYRFYVSKVAKYAIFKSLIY